VPAVTISEALEETLASDARYAEKQHSALVSLCRLLALQIDAADAEATNRLTAAYLSALKDLGRIRDGKPVATASPKTEGGDGSGSSALGKLRSIKGAKAS
jgi:hypothetical protein